jgi:trans-aconitate 2-methyltransferase
VANDASEWQFAGAEDTTARLAEAGFGQVDVQVVPDPVRLRPGAQLEEFLATVVLGAVLRDLPEAERQPFVRTVAGRLDEPVIDYVRLRLSAVRT